MDGGGYAHISYVSQDVLAYAYQVATGWHTEVIDTGLIDECSLSSSLALDENGNPHVSYCAAFDLRYAHRDVSGWHVESSLAYPVEDVTSLILDDDGYPHISFQSWGTSSKITYAHENGGDPKAEVSAKADSKLSHAYKDAAGWHMETVDSTNCF